MALQLYTLAEIQLTVLEVYCFSVVSSEELLRQPIVFSLWAALTTSPPFLPIGFLISIAVEQYFNYLIITYYENISFFCNKYLLTVVFGNLKPISNMPELDMALVH